MKQGWKIKAIGEICKLKSGNSNANNSLKGELPYVKVSDMSIIGNEIFINTSSQYIDYQNNIKSIFPKGTVIFPKRGGAILTNKKRLTLREICCDLNIMGVIPSVEIHPFYLYYYFQNINLSELCDGASIPQINNNDIAPLVINYPSLSEQERIVGILDSAFAKIEALRANAQQNLQNTKDLFQASIDKAYAIPAESRSISSVAKVINGYAFSSNDFKPTNSVKSIKITNVGVGEFIEESDNYLPAEYADRLQDAQVSSGDIVIALTRTIISAGLKVAVVPDCYNGALVNQRVAALVSLQGVMSREYLYNFLLTTRVKNYVLAHVNTLMQPNLSITDLKNMDVPYLPYEEQKVVASKIDALSERCRAMEENYRQTIAHCNALKQALLTKAFNGEL